MGREEQIEEREVLDSIFPDEITGPPLLRPIPPFHQLILPSADIDETSYRIAIKPDIPSVNSDDLDAEAPIVLLTVTYPPSYPDEAPILDLSLPPNAPKISYLDLSTDSSTLLSSLKPTITENLGMAMIFTLVTTLQESIESLIRSRIADVQKAKDREQEEAEAKENAKFHGERVTRESFLKWRERFREETSVREEEERLRKEREAEGKVKGGGKKEDKLTGRELWEKGLVGKEVEEEDVTGAEEGIEGLIVG
ncbi:MAG: hypothetical protein LQ338_006413 [Usnochroma carphineum]|nr:MAG: hypothetical protein LQ338_006413 [Usnochroma carphineum]